MLPEKHVSGTAMGTEGQLEVPAALSTLAFFCTVYDLLSGHIVKKLTNHKACVRDVSWHPFEEKIVSSSVRLQGLEVGGRCVSRAGTGRGIPLTAYHFLLCSGMGTYVYGSTAKLSTSRTTCQSLM